MTINWQDPATVTAMDAAGPTSGVMADASAIINQTLSQYGLSTLSNWAWNEITNGSSADQVLLDLTRTPQFGQRFPGIIARQNSGLPPISPADYVNYENNAKQLENQYGLPKGFLSDSGRIGDLIGKDVSANELQERVQNGYAQVAFAPPEVRQAFTAMFGANGDGALASHFLDTTQASKLLTQQATAAQISGEATMGGINMEAHTALQLAQMGQTQSSVGANFADLQKNASLYNAQVGETATPALTSEKGVEAEFGLSTSATQQVIQRQQERQAAFQGGGSAAIDTTGAHGAGPAKPI